MKILSIDVGIYNLAVCLLNVTDNITIEFWKDINILSGKQTCSVKGCKRVATHVKDNKYYCIKCKTTLFANKRIQTVKTAMNTSIEKIAQLLYKTLDEELTVPRLTEELTVPNLTEELTVPKLTEELTVPRQELTEEQSISVTFLEFDKVLIENQPTKNIKMKNISMLLLGYFTKLNKSVEFVNATKKMHETLFKLPNNYSNRKKASKFTVKSLLKSSDWGLFFKCSKKQDDLSDSLLQGLWWIHTNIDKNKELSV